MKCHNKDDKTSRMIQEYNMLAQSNLKQNGVYTAYAAVTD